MNVLTSSSIIGKGHGSIRGDLVIGDSPAWRLNRNFFDIRLHHAAMWNCLTAKYNQTSSKIGLTEYQ